MCAPQRTLTVGYTINAALRGITVNELEVKPEGDLYLAGFFGISEDTRAGLSGVPAKVHLAKAFPARCLTKNNPSV